MLNITIASLALSSFSQSPFLSSSLQASKAYSSFKNIHYFKSISSFLRFSGLSKINFQKSKFEKIMDTAIVVNDETTTIRVQNQTFSETLSYSCSSSINFHFCTFKFCITQTNNGGAIRYGSTICKNKQSLRLVQCIFYGCRSLSGGAFYACTSGVLIVKTQFINCMAKNEDNIFMCYSVNSEEEDNRNYIRYALFMNNDDTYNYNNYNFKCVYGTYILSFINSSSINMNGAGAFGVYNGIKETSFHHINIINNKGKDLFSLQNVNQLKLDYINIINNTIYNFPFAYSNTYIIAKIMLSNFYFKSNSVNFSGDGTESVYPIIMLIESPFISDVNDLEKIFGENVKFNNFQIPETGNPFSFTIEISNVCSDNFTQNSQALKNYQYPKILTSITILTLIVGITSAAVHIIYYLYQARGISKWAEESATP